VSWEYKFRKTWWYHPHPHVAPRLKKEQSYTSIPLDVHGSVHQNTNLIEMTNKMELCGKIYYSIVSWLLNMFRAILSLIIRNFLTVITASGFTHVGTQPWQRPATSNVSKTRSCNYSLEAPDDERQYRSKHVEQSRNNGIINCITQLHLVGHFYKIMSDNIVRNMLSSQGTME